MGQSSTEKMLNGTKCRIDTISNGEQNMKGHKVHSTKRRIGHHIKWEFKMKGQKVKIIIIEWYTISDFFIYLFYLLSSWIPMVNQYDLHTIIENFSHWMFCPLCLFSILAFVPVGFFFHLTLFPVDFFSFPLLCPCRRFFHSLLFYVKVFPF